ncbi:hypothetical protein LLE97_05255 [Holdemanella biformis]|uniref:hypothetical protein n=1 Tax=Holdemanella biformis TaxID=1735 RepID=UPI001D1587B8|nr:hypothetical protein [Holdemanella biformis]MCC3353925.1 hypothetical protein [Holdemanella biformis]
MGSGTSGSYSGTKGSSQPYSSTYSVVKSEMDKDKKDPDIYNPKTGYFKNPTALSLEDSISGNNIYVDGHRQGGKITYVLDKNGKIIIGKRFNPNNPNKRAPHPTLIGGKNPKVQCAGIIEFQNGKIYKIDHMSGHFRPNIKSLEKVEKALDNLYKKNPNVFSKKSKWRKK